MHNVRYLHSLVQCCGYIVGFTITPLNYNRNGVETIYSAHVQMLIYHDFGLIGYVNDAMSSSVKNHWIELTIIS